MKITERLALLRSAMKEQNIDFYLITTADYHSSEYVSDYFKVREYFSGFTGSNGDLLVWQDGAGLWTDGRYFVQAEKELEGSGITLYRMLVEGVPSLNEFLKANLGNGQTLAFDGRTISANNGLKYEKLASDANGTVCYDADLAKELWENRPQFPANKVWAMDEEYAGIGIEEKLVLVREQLEKENAQALFLTKLDDIMWLLNLRGMDVECNPVAMSNCYVSASEIILFIQNKVLSAELKQYLEKQHVTVKEYGTELLELNNVKEQNILVDCRYVSFYFYKAFRTKSLINKPNPTELLKARKNPTELKNMEQFYLLDSAAVTKFIFWLKKKADIRHISEADAADYLDNLRKQIPGYLDLSFPTISAYGANGAMMHYEATGDNCSMLKKEGFLLVDSGGQYMGATTDVTRTISLGPLTKQMRQHYSLTAKGMLNLTNATFLEGCTGRNVDILARMPLWETGQDYRCGTGHGVGYVLNVHEGPHGIRWRYVEGNKEALLLPGMVVTNEPGVYLEGEYGIRIENVMTVVQRDKNEYGQFLGFSTLTYVPLDREAIDLQYFDEKSIDLLNRYNASVYEKIKDFLTEEEKSWLKEETQPFVR